MATTAFNILATTFLTKFKKSYVSTSRISMPLACKSRFLGRLGRQIWHKTIINPTSGAGMDMASNNYQSINPTSGAGNFGIWSFLRNSYTCLYRYHKYHSLQMHFLPPWKLHSQMHPTKNKSFTTQKKQLNNTDICKWLWYPDEYNFKFLNTVLKKIFRFFRGEGGYLLFGNGMTYRYMTYQHSLFLV